LEEYLFSTAGEKSTSHHVAAVLQIRRWKEHKLPHPISNSSMLEWYNQHQSCACSAYFSGTTSRQSKASPPELPTKQNPEPQHPAHCYH